MLRSLFADPLVVNPEDRDFLNRMFPFNQTQYRYRYDGQMGIEDVSGSVVTRYGLGARGVDFIEQSTGTGTATVFPIYDAHGNNVASLSRDGSGYQVSNRRSFDAWGNVRLGAQTGDPTGRYCANLGHKQDDESGLVYMRARYYEPSSGRFVSQDTAKDGLNWFVYGRCSPTNAVDPNGREAVAQLFGVGQGLMALAGIITYYTYEPGSLAVACFLAAAGTILTAIGSILSNADVCFRVAGGLVSGSLSILLFMSSRMFSQIVQMTTAQAIGAKTCAAKATTATYFYSLTLMTVLLEMDLAEASESVLTNLLQGAVYP